MEPGLSATVSLVVGEADTAIALGSGEVSVLATPRVVALCEAAAVAAVRDALSEGHTSVGYKISLDHLTPTLVGGEVEARAELTAVDGSKLTFEIGATEKAPDGGEPKQIARGSHVRVVVEEEGFLRRAGAG